MTNLKKRLSVDFKIPLILALGGGFGAAAGCGFISFYWLLFPAVFGIFLPARGRIALILSLVAATLSGGLWRREQNNIRKEYFRSGQVEGVVVIRDNRASRQRDIALTSRIRGEFKAHGSKRTVPVLLRFPEWKRGIPLLYGDRFEVTGALRVPDAAGFYCDRDGIIEAIPPPYGDDFMLTVREHREIEAENSLKRWCFYLREAALKRLLCHLETPEIRKMAARLLLGASDGAAPDVKRNFVLSGIIHLFAVSGMHVGILALVAGILIRPLPVRVRYWLLTVITVFYVAASGMAIPALRAGMMIGVWAVLRACLLHTDAVNILSLAYFILCIGEPDAVGDLGAQYSYGITVVLIMGVSALREQLHFSRWKLFLMPGNAKLTMGYLKKSRRRNSVITAVAVPALAFTASSMLTMRYSKLFLPGSIMTNLLVTFITPLIFVIFLFKMIFGWIWSGVDHFSGIMLDGCFQLLKWCSEISLAVFGELPVIKPAWYLCAIFYILLLTGIWLKDFRYRFGMFLACIAILMIPAGLAMHRPAEVIVVSGSSGHPPLLAYLPEGERRAQVCNIPDSWSGVIAADELLRRGCNEAEIFFSGTYNRHNSGMKAFASRIKVVAIHLPEGKTSHFFDRNLQSDKGKFLPLCRCPGASNVQTSGDGSLSWRVSTELKLCIADGDDGRTVTWRLKSQIEKTVTIPWSNHLLLWRSAVFEK